MCTTIALLSGKGGSGKTTLALNISDLMRRCQIKTLLIDCDLCTNGASYFYESQLIDQLQNRRIKTSTFLELLTCKQTKKQPQPFEIDSYYHFIPSISINSCIIKKDDLGCDDYCINNLQDFVEWAKTSYDVILFDCQAGYTELLSELLPLMDIDLFVLETDSISAAALRNLHLKIGNMTNRAKLYQIFNKATLEEYDIYSKIAGTFFVNVGTLLFDWKIRQAFSRSQIPDFENISREYGLGLCEVCKIIMSEKSIQEKIERFREQIVFQQLQEERSEIEKNLKELRSKPNSVRRLIVKALPFLTSIMAFSMSLLFVFSIENEFFSIRNTTVVNVFFLILFAFVVLSGVVFMLYNYRDFFRENRYKQIEYEKKMYDLDVKIKKIEKKQNKQDEKQKKTH